MIETTRVLIIDNDGVDRQALVRAMEKYPAKLVITEAASAQGGLGMAKSGEFDVVLLDYRLPDSDGMEVLARLRIDSGHETAIIIISSYEDAAMADEAIANGAQDFLLKSEVTPARLARAVRLAQQRMLIELALSTSHQQMRKLAKFDVLTGLGNRRSFELAMESAVAIAERNKSSLAILLLDLDRFKDINDTLGHEVGDELLVEVAARLSNIVRESDVLARLGGDEFVVLCQNMVRDDQVLLLAERLLQALSTPIVLGDKELPISTSIGIAVFGTDATNYSDLVKCADIAMYRAKHEGRNRYQFYSENLQKSVIERVSIENGLRNALKLEQFELYYQPQFWAADGTLGGMEALVRWNHPEQGMLLPGKFLPIAETSGLMGDIGSWVLEAACKQLRTWQEKYPRFQELSLSVNLSAIELEGKGYANRMENIIKASHLNAGQLELEVTESTIFNKPQKTADLLTKLTCSGVSLSLDDFGTGYSSFQHLLLFPIKSLKIDRSFVMEVGKDTNSERLLLAIIQFAKTFKVRVVAEGIETPEQEAFCRMHGCDLLQGFYFSKPLSADLLESKYLSAIEDK